jgi:hypothetical protein
LHKIKDKKHFIMQSNKSNNINYLQKRKIQGNCFPKNRKGINTMGTRKKVVKMVIEVLEGMDKVKIQQAVSFWERQQTEGKKTREQWYNLGGVLRSAKQALDGNTTKFGKWRTKHFPGITSHIGSCAQTVYLHQKAVEKYATKHRPAVNNPMTILRMYQTDTKIRLKSDGTTEKIIEPEVPEVPEAGKNEGGIDSILETFRKACNQIIGIDFENLTPEHKIKIAELNSSIGNYLKNGESVKIESDNPVVESKIIDDLEKPDSKKYAKAKGRS